MSKKELAFEIIKNMIKPTVRKVPKLHCWELDSYVLEWQINDKKFAFLFVDEKQYKILKEML